MSNAPCVFFARGACRNGSTCSYSHAALAKPAAQDEPASPSPLQAPQASENIADTRAQVPCHFFLSGRCLKGDGCPFSHPDAAVGGPVETPAPAVDDDDKVHASRIAEELAVVADTSVG